ncbi:hypothetical protein [Streptomyces sp. CAU 1734]|uniref:hypothetical protein n=1 Tax=Streptomyces sp. CAU 1734 TaxID=3140360 RepID=UPI0032603CE9
MTAFRNTGFPLYARSRSLPLCAAVLLAAAVLVLWRTGRTDGAGRSWDPGFGVPMTAVGPLIAAIAIGTTLYVYADELDRTAARAWWPRRLAHLLALAVCAAAVLALATAAAGVPDTPGGPAAFEPGAPAMVRNTLGAAGLAAIGAVVLGARLSWLPPLMYPAMALPQGHQDGRVAALARMAQPDGRWGAWVTAGLLLTAGAALYAWRGARRPGR